MLYHLLKEECIIISLDKPFLLIGVVSINLKLMLDDTLHIA